MGLHAEARLPASIGNTVRSVSRQPVWLQQSRRPLAFADQWHEASKLAALLQSPLLEWERISIPRPCPSAGIELKAQHSNRLTRFHSDLLAVH